MATKKIFNDPIYGFISFPFEFIYELIGHPIFQRLRRISQVGLSSYVYPGATHSRFHHALGATHLCVELIQVLRNKGADISEEEFEATCIAVLLHDIGHGPFSHALERQLVNEHHEDLTIHIMQRLNCEYSGRLTLAISLFKKEYHKSFLSSIISSQLDVDRMDYLNRDSFYTGVTEGKIGYERIIKMMRIVQGHLVVEKKGLHSIEKFLLSRYFMYRQVYLHKTAVAAEQMLKGFILRYKELSENNNLGLHPIFDRLWGIDRVEGTHLIDQFLQLDDTDVLYLIKRSQSSDDYVLSYLAKGIINRKLHKTIFSSTLLDTFTINEYYSKTSSREMSKDNFMSLTYIGAEQYVIYNDQKDPILVVDENDNILTFTSLMVLPLTLNVKEEHYAVIPR